MRTEDCKLGKQFTNLIKKLLDNREWTLKLSLRKRCCYISGQSLWFKVGYRGRRKIWSIIDNGHCINDDIWLSDREYHLMIKQGVVNV